MPEEQLGFLLVGCEADITRKTAAIDLDVAAVCAFQGDDTSAAINDFKLRQSALVAGMGVVEQPVRQGNGRKACSQIDDADGLAVRDVLAAISTGLADYEVVELGIAAFKSFMIEGKERMTGALEGDQLIRERHHAA